MATERKAKWVEIGEVGVDSGSLMICDPCYVIGEQNSGGQAFPTWDKFLEEQRQGGGQWSLRHQVNYAMGHPGLGVVAGTAFGDGCFKVYGLKYDDESDRTDAIMVITGDVAPPV